MRIELSLTVVAETGEGPQFNLERLQDGLVIIAAELSRDAYTHAEVEIDKGRGE